MYKVLRHLALGKNVQKEKCGNINAFLPKVKENIWVTDNI